MSISEATDGYRSEIEPRSAQFDNSKKMLTECQHDGILHLTAKVVKEM